MAANYLADENPEQIGCVFQIFNRHHSVSTRRIVGKRCNSGTLFFNNERDSSLEKHRLSTESSKDSFSSWCPSSPFSNVDYNIDNHQNIDHRDVVKDSIYDALMEQDDSNILYCHKPRELSRSKSCQFKDGFSFSLSKEYPRLSFDGEETDILLIKTDSKITNQRLSLDSREPLIRTLSSVSLVPNKPSNRNPKVNSEVNANNDLSQRRPPSVVAKLMGLETFPSLKSVNSSNDRVTLIKSTLREPTSPCWKNVDVKPISKVPIEAAPWKQRDGVRATTASTKTRVPVLNVYSEVDKRLKNLEFSESGKDLRALKQILEAMQAVEARSSDRSNDQETLSESKESGISNESSIVIMKPAKKGFINNNTGKDLITESTRGERRSRPSIPRTDSGKPRKQSNKPQLGSRTRRQRSPNSTPEKSTMHVKVGERVAPEQPSPVSVLDDSVYVDNPPSPVKRTTITKKDDTPNSANTIVKDRHEAVNGIQSNTTISFQITREKLKRVEDLVQKLKNLNSSHNESPADYIASFCENTNPNNTYISQILLSSGLLLRDLKSFEFHPSSHPINPELFSVLEHTKFSNLQNGKRHRKLIFDAVNEILVGKLSSTSRMMMMMQDSRKLLRELCLEIEQQLVVHKKQDGCGPGNEDDDLKNILVEDLSKMSENWTGFCGEIQVIGVEVEQLIFRDLVDEVVMSCARRSSSEFLGKST
ncbi:putative protein LONGIFOLIA 1/2 [Helianthus annuus]|uniref:Putative DUF3741-associated sequence motif protein n=1 Tax=Helianthus annuus TaxID=4232 RepID=A0A251VFE1_HELAN|nr:protein LONGIFOLIA 1 [Helianthus annuus]KAF5818162.1 putative protein LONGIFOLIA 1/2 [Helianthus annuus]